MSRFRDDLAENYAGRPVESTKYRNAVFDSQMRVSGDASLWQLLRETDSHSFRDHVVDTLEFSGLWAGVRTWSRPNGSDAKFETTISPISGDNRTDTTYVATLRDVSGQKALERELLYQTSRDALTGLPNRRSIPEMLTIAVLSSNRPDLHTAVLFLDLDNFKLVNDSLGHVVVLAESRVQ